MWIIDMVYWLDVYLEPYKEEEKPIGGQQAGDFAEVDELALVSQFHGFEHLLSSTFFESRNLVDKTRRRCPVLEKQKIKRNLEFHVTLKIFCINKNF